MLNKKKSDIVQSGSDLQAFMKQQVLDKMKSTLQHRPDIIEAILPKDFDLGCRRVTPGLGFLVPELYSLT
jgi:hypothetical protein